MKLQSRPPKDEPKYELTTDQVEHLARSVVSGVPTSGGGRVLAAVQGLLHGLRAVKKIEDYVTRLESGSRTITVYLQVGPLVERFTVDY